MPEVDPRAIGAAGAAIELWLAEDRRPPNPLPELEREAAVALLKDMRARYEGLDEYVARVCVYASAHARASMAAQVGATQAMKSQANMDLSDAETRLVGPDKVQIVADDPVRVLTVYAALSRIAAKELPGDDRR